MKACLIAPVPDLERFVLPSFTHHLLLAHLMDVPGYLDFYMKRSNDGDFLILDNGAKELGMGLGLKELLKHASILGAKEVVLTDVRFSMLKTMHSGMLELDWLDSDDGQRAYDRAGSPNLMIVPQGATPKEWKACLFYLLELIHDRHYLRPPTIGIGYHYDHIFDQGLPPLLVNDDLTGHEVHLLGWTRHLETLRNVMLNEGNRIRSVDSSRSFVYAINGQGCHGAYPGRTVDYFTEPIPEQMHGLVRKNIDVFCRYAGDTSYRNICLECGSTHLDLRNHDLTWHDGDVHCENGHYVRAFDGG